MDEQLLTQLDADPEVRRHGRSAVMRRAVMAYLAQRRSEQIEQGYQRAYANDPGLGDEFSHWEDQGQWPDD